MNLLKLRVDQIKNLISLAEERNLPVPVSAADIDEILAEDVPEVEKLRNLGRIASIVHEILYAPPNRG